MNGVEIQNLSFNKMYLKISSAKMAAILSQPQCVMSMMYIKCLYRNTTHKSDTLIILLVAVINIIHEWISVQDCSALAMELLQSCTKPLVLLLMYSILLHWIISGWNKPIQRKILSLYNSCFRLFHFMSVQYHVCQNLPCFRQIYMLSFVLKCHFERLMIEIEFVSSVINSHH